MSLRLERVAAWIGGKCGQIKFSFSLGCVSFRCVGLLAGSRWLLKNLLLRVDDGVGMLVARSCDCTLLATPVGILGTEKGDRHLKTCTLPWSGRLTAFWIGRWAVRMDGRLLGWCFVPMGW